MIDPRPDTQTDNGRVTLPSSRIVGADLLSATNSRGTAREFQVGLFALLALEALV